MKIIADIVDRYSVLQKMAEDPKVINEDGTQVDPYLEIAAELFEIPRRQVTFEYRNHAIKIVRSAVQNDILRTQFKSSPYQNYQNTGTPW